MEHQPDRIDVEELVERLDRAETELSALKALVGRMVEGLAWPLWFVGIVLAAIFGGAHGR